MDTKDQIKQLLDAVGSVCEIAAFMRKTLLANGFTREEAVDISKEYVVATLTIGDNNDKKGT